jgi:hypothetical protein
MGTNLNRSFEYETALRVIISKLMFLDQCLYLKHELIQWCQSMKLKNLFFPAHLEQIERYGFPIMIFISVYGFFLAVVNPTYFDQIYTMKYGYLCYQQTLFILIMMLLSAKRSVNAFFHHKLPLLGFIQMLFVGLFLFGVGEKMRYGQFIFDLELPEFFQKYNSQSQITVHNLVFDDFSVNKVIFGTILGILIVIYCIILPLLHAYKPKIRSLIDTLGLPMATRPQILWYLFGAIIAMNIPAPRKGEVLELVGCFSILMIFAFPKNRSIFKEGENRQN